MRRVRLCVLAPLLALMAAHPAPAQQQQQQQEQKQQAERAESSASALAGRMPRSAELIVVFEGAAGLRRSALWERLRPVLGDLTALADTWDRLAQTLGWTPEETFDRVLGARVALVVQGLPGHAGLLGDGAEAPAGAPPEVRWALISEVSAETERRLLERLAAAPRDIVRGCQLLAVERGAYELAIYRPKAAAGPGAKTTLIFGESGKAELLDEMVGVLTDGAAAPMRGTPAHRALAGLGRADVAVLYRWPDGAGDAWSDYAAVAIRREGGEVWSTRLSVHDAALAPDLLRIPPSTDAAFRALGESSLAAIVETRVAGDGGGGAEANPASVVLRMLGIPDGVQDRLGQRQVLVAAETTPADGAGSGLGVAVGLELMDIPGAAPEADRFLASLASSLEGERGGEQGGEGAAGGVPDFGGIAPGAVRSVPLRSMSEPLRTLLCGGVDPDRKRGAGLAWVFAESGRGDGHGWWVVGAAPDGPGSTGAADLIRGVVADLAGSETEATPPARWISQGVLRPGAIMRRLGEAPAAAAPAYALLGRLRMLSWRLRVGDSGSLEGSVHVEISGDEANGSNK